ncbi:MAG: ABC transporter ATP-binding protein [Bacteroidetes bacterium]|nr:MAG: ABC transporter ATP-binding protein [Bacteroidota bacterium]
MLSIQHVSKHYAGKTALNKVSLEVREGSVFGLLGPNGAGKTSLIRIITLITAPDEGEILFQGQPITRDLITRIGYLPEERGLYRKMEVIEQALYFAKLKGLSTQEAKTRVKDWFQRLDMWSWRGKKVEELSKGMQQKLQFVLTVIHNPKLIILDEPFTGFDPVNAEVIKQEILHLKEQGSTVILSTHRMESVEELCDDIALINKSEVVLSGEVEEVRHRYKKNEFEVIYEGEALEAIEGGTVLHTTTLKNGQHRSMLSSQTESPKQMLHGLIDQREVHAFKELIPSIKDIFIEIVGGSI